MKTYIVFFILSLLIGVCLWISCDNTPQVVAVDEVPKEVEIIKSKTDWAFEGLDWDKESTHLQQGLYTLELIDATIARLEIRSNNFQTMAKLLEVRAIILMQLYNSNPPKFYGHNENQQ